MYADIALFMIAFIVFTLSLVGLLRDVLPFDDFIIAQVEVNVK